MQPFDDDHVLFQPVKIGRMQLSHRVVMAPLTRHRADENHVHGDLGVEYYSQRASVPGTLLIAEATFISPQAGGYDNVPGIYTADQIAGWKRITGAVHAKRSFIYLQLWAVGRVAHASVLAREGGFSLVSASPIPLKRNPTPRPLTVTEIKQYVRDYAQATRNAMEAGFDGVELHSANGYLIDEFLQDVTNKRTDEYGGSIENRARFGIEVIRAMVDVIGQDRVGIRLSPWSTRKGMGMADPAPQFLYFINSLKNNHPGLAYLHMVEPETSHPSAANDIFRTIWAPRPFLSASGYDRETALAASEQRGDVIVFGRLFIANPDLPHRLRKNIRLNSWDHSTFYTPQSAIGYTDYPFANEQQNSSPLSRL